MQNESDAYSKNQPGFCQCQYLSPEGYRCQQHSETQNLCFWHNNETIKNDEKLVNKLQQLAKEDISLIGYSLKRADLQDLNLVHQDSKSGYDLSYADLYRANLSRAHLFNIDLHGASLMKADLQNANLHCANLENCNLLGINLTNARIENVYWGNKILQEKQAESARQAGKYEQMLDSLEQAEEIYRNLRKTAENQGLFELSGSFFYKEMVMRRFQLPLFSIRRGISSLVDWFCGYGEKPLNVVFFSLFLIAVCTVIYFIFGLSSNEKLLQLDFASGLYGNFITLLECLYFSVVTFTTLGYGDIVPVGATRPVAALEAFTGNFTIALFVVVFVKKMTR